MRSAVATGGSLERHYGFQQPLAVWPDALHVVTSKLRDDGNYI